MLLAVFHLRTVETVIYRDEKIGAELYSSYLGQRKIKLINEAMKREKEPQNPSGTVKHIQIRRAFEQNTTH